MLKWELWRKRSSKYIYQLFKTMRIAFSDERLDELLVSIQKVYPPVGVYPEVTDFCTDVLSGNTRFIPIIGWMRISKSGSRL